jgi:hypothetical protein
MTDSSVSNKDTIWHQHEKYRSGFKSSGAGASIPLSGKKPSTEVNNHAHELRRLS